MINRPTRSEPTATRTPRRRRAAAVWRVALSLALACVVAIAGLQTAPADEQPAPATQPTLATQPATSPADGPPVTRPAAATRPPRRLATRPASGATQPVLTRLPPRPTLDDAAYRELARSLREAYAKPPAEWPKPTVDAGVAFKELGVVPPPPVPADNLFTKEKADLGLQLFFDPKLSGSRQIACASCHDPDLGWADGRTVAFGHERQPLKRNAIGLTDVAHHASLFWDGRVGSLEDQVHEVVLNNQEMSGDEDQIVERLQKEVDYRKRFTAVFGDDRVTLRRVAQALATFQRTLVSGRSRFDRFLKGQPEMLSDSAVRGLHLFRTDARCANCHHGPRLTDDQFHDVGLSYYGRLLQDLGRYTVTKKPQDVGAFRTPSLRNVGRTAPYMHNGIFELDGVLNLYNAGMPTLRRRPEQANDPLFPTKSALLKPLGLNRQDLDDLKAFLESLNEPKRRIRVVPDEPEGQ